MVSAKYKVEKFDGRNSLVVQIKDGKFQSEMKGADVTGMI